jgi:diguanylate cyclase (GGDEF)-like protein
MTPLRDQVTTPAPERPRQAADPETLLLSGLFQRLPIVILLNLAVALGTVLVFAGRRPLAVIASWFLFMLATLALRLWAWQARRRATAAAALLPVRARQFTLGAAATGLAWGLAGVLFYSPDAQVSQIFLPFIMAGMVGGSVTALTGYMPAYVAFSTSMLVPYAARLAVEGDGVHLVMASLTLLYLVGMGLLGRTVNASMVAAVRLAAENEALVAALREKSAQLEATFDNVNQGVAVFDREGLLETWNPRHRALHGYPAELYRRGVAIGEFVRHDRQNGTPAGAPPEGLGPTAPVRFEQPGAAGRVLEVERSPMPGGGFVSTSTDITERKRAEDRMLHLAQHDPLTGLSNRLLFNDRLQQAMALARRSGNLMAVILLDLDNFKQVNDVLGHPVGDRALKQTATRLRAALRASDTVARFGGDEFAFILQELPDARAATVIADKLVGQLGQPLDLEGRTWQLRASLGIALFPSDGTDAEQLMKNADRAMYRAKAAGGGFELAAGGSGRRQTGATGSSTI